MVQARPRKDTVDEAVEEVKGAEESGFELRTLKPADVTPSFQGTLYIRNETNTIVRFDILGGEQSESFKLEQAGKDDSIKVLPLKAALNPGLRRFWRAGKVTVTDDPNIEIEFDRYSDHEIELERLQQTKINGIIEKPVYSIPAPFAIHGIQQPGEVR